MIENVFEVKRNLDGCYFRIQRNNRWENVCFSDLTDEEREMIATMNGGRTAEWWKSLAYHLADKLKQIGNTFDIIGE